MSSLILRLLIWLSAVALGAFSFAGSPASQTRDRPNPFLNLYGVYLIDARTGWAVGEQGLIVVTRDGGVNWQQQRSGVGTTLSGVHFSDARAGWAVGGGQILATTDGGENWRKQTSGTSETLGAVYALHRAAGRVAWAVGSKGTILRTNDGGTHWDPQKSGIDTPLWAVDFVDELRGWAVGSNGVILATRDGGETWRPQTSDTTEGLNGVSFADARTGWAVGSNGVILATRDGGETWRPKTSGAEHGLLSVSFSSARTGWVAGLNGVILTTRDGGDTWRPQASGIDKHLGSVSFADSSKGCAAGADGVILSTNNGGDTWQVFQVGDQDQGSKAQPVWLWATLLTSATAMVAGVASGITGLLSWLRRRREREIWKRDKEFLRFQLDRQRLADAEKSAELSARPAAAAPAPAPVIVPDVPNELVDALNRRECALFWGGGLSAQAGYPTWRETLAQMIERVNADNSFKAELQKLLRAGRFSFVVDALATRLTRNEIIQQLSAFWGAPSSVTPAINALANLPFTNAVTSVWDPLIE